MEASNETPAKLPIGVTAGVVGSIVDVTIGGGVLPVINHALATSIGDKRVVLEVQQHLDLQTVLCVALGDTSVLG